MTKAAVASDFKEKCTAIAAIVDTNSYDGLIASMGALGTVAAKCFAAFPEELRQERLKTWIECIQDTLLEYAPIADAFYAAKKMPQ